MTIRVCGKEDFLETYAVVNDAAVAYRGHIPDDCWHEPYMTKEALENEIKSGVVFYGCSQSAVCGPGENRGQKTKDRKLKAEDSRLVGVMGLQEVGDVSLIRHAYVLPEFQGRGIGSGLIKRLLDEARSKTVLVGTWAAATWAIRFYERCGFRLVSPAEKDMLLRRYWTVTDRQIETSVVLKRHLA